MRLFRFGVGLFLLSAAFGAVYGAAPAVTSNPERGRAIYLRDCATCHGVSGKGSWRAWLFLIRPGDLTDAEKIGSLSDQYLFDLLKHGGAPIGKPGMPSFSFQLSDEEIRDVIGYVRTLSHRE